MKALQNPARRRNRRNVFREVLTLGAALGLLASAAATAGVLSAPVRLGVQGDPNTGRIVLNYDIENYSIQRIPIEDRTYTLISLDKAVNDNPRGAPDLPWIARSVIIPNDAAMTAQLVRAHWLEIKDVDILPSRGKISREIDPSGVPYVFGDAYKISASYPESPVTMGSPYVFRGYRGVVVKFCPFQYNPVTRVLRFCTKAIVEVVKTGQSKINVLGRSKPTTILENLAFSPLYQHQFENYTLDPNLIITDPNSFTTTPVWGRMLVICHDAWVANMNPFVTHKNNIGLETTVVGVGTIPGGNTPTAIKNYIQSVYDDTGLDYVLLVGDSTQVATPNVIANGQNGASDPMYALLGGSDSYPDISVGRFSAETAEQVDTQVARSVAYEAGAAPSQAWCKQGIGIASSQGPGDDGERDYEHIDNIRTQLLGAWYTAVDQVYDPTATADAVTNAVNAGRGIINYCGHGSVTGWTSSGFGSTHITNLNNAGMLPMIFSVACVNGRFNGTTCFAETWLRSTRDGEPIGAVAAYMSSINQSWSPPMSAQDAFADLLVHRANMSFGDLCYAASCEMIDQYGVDGVDMFNTWHVFGDPSLRVLPQWMLDPNMLLRVFELFEVSIIFPWPPEPTDAPQPEDLGDVVIETINALQKRITATPKAGAVFTRWEGDVPESLATTNPLVLSLDRNLTITPVFSQQQNLPTIPCLPTAGFLGTVLTILAWPILRKRGPSGP